MCRKLMIAWGVALAATFGGPTVADDLPVPVSFPSAQSAGRPGDAPGMPGTPASGQLGDSGLGGTAQPYGSPLDGEGSGAFTGAAGPESSGTVGGTSTAASGFSPGLGGFGGGSGAPPAVIGDFQPISGAKIVRTTQSTRFPNLPTPTPPPRVANGKPGIVNGNGTTSILFTITGLKIADNQSPIPQDRFFYSFNYFDNLNASINRRQMSPVSNLQVYHHLFGLEKTFFDGRASIGFRVPLNTISLNSSANIPGLGGTSTAAGDLSIFLKAIFYQRENFLFSGGLQVTAPTGPGAFGGNKYYSYFRDTQIQPFVGFLFLRDRFYFQGFSSINVPTTSEDVTLLFNDLSMGYYVYRPTDPNKFVSAIVPAIEAHLTTPLNHRGFDPNDIASTPDILNLTFGTNLEIRRRAVLSAAYVTPVTGPKPFNAELVLLLNIRFGRSVRRLSPLTPPILN